MRPLRAYVLQARRGGAAGVYEVASKDKLSPRQLGVLAQSLREFDPDWRLTLGQRHDLVDRLLEAGVKVGQICELVGCDRTTVWRRRRNFADRAAGGEGTPANPLSMRAECCKTAESDLRVGGPVAGLHFDASSGA